MRFKVGRIVRYARQKQKRTPAGQFATLTSNRKAHTAIAVTRSPYRATSLIERLRAAMSRLSYLLLLIVAYSSPATAQHPEQNGPRSLNYGFVSPNTRDDLQLSDAIKGMNST